MEELINNPFIRQSFPSQFDSYLWEQISSEPPSNFQAKQLMIYNVLRKNTCLSDQYFEIFEKNHLKLYEWYLMAVRDKVELEPYLFRPLLQKTPSFRRSKTKKLTHGCYPHRSSRTEPNQVQKMLITPSMHKVMSKTLYQENINSHDLYIQTFAACGGERYVPYDYGRHMKSRMERAHYNKYIHQYHKRNNTNPSQAENPLSKFTEWEQVREKIALIPFRGILGNIGLNSQRSLQKMLKKKGSQKIVFVNHQRKPVNFYLRSQVVKQGK